MKLFIKVLFLVFMLGACQNVERPEMPQNLIDRQTMVDILADAYVGNAARSINNRLLRTAEVQLDSVLYNKFNIDSLQFAQSNAYYVSDLNGYIEIFKDVEKLLQERKVVVDTLIVQKERAEKKRRDSIRREDSLAGKPLPKMNRSKNKKNKKPSLVDPVQEE